MSNQISHAYTFSLPNATQFITFIKVTFFSLQSCHISNISSTQFQFCKLNNKSSKKLYLWYTFWTYNKSKRIYAWLTNWSTLQIEIPYTDFFPSKVFIFRTFHQHNINFVRWTKSSTKTHLGYTVWTSNWSKRINAWL